MSVDLSELLNLDPVEKLRIIAALEESLANQGPLQLSPEQRDEIRRRKRELDANPESAISWEVLEQYLDSDHV